MKNVNMKSVNMKNVVVLGDSISRGIVLKNEKYTILDDGFVDQCAKALHLDVHNFSKMGCTITKGEQILEQHKDDVSKAHLTVLEYGGNDSDFFWRDIAAAPDAPHAPKTDIHQFHALYVQLINRVRALGSKPVLFSLPLMDGQRFYDFTTRNMSSEERTHVFQWLGGQIERIRNYHDMYNLEVFHIAREQGVPIVDITSPFLWNTDYTQYLCADGIHPSADGHRLIATTVERYYQSFMLNV